jgi:formylglycine-generating enzyme required for sulfatase activity
MNGQIAIFATLISYFLPYCNIKLPKPCPKTPDGMSCIPGGYFERGASNRKRDQRNPSIIWVDTFFMDRYEVTAKEYDKCVREGRCIYQRTNYPKFSGDQQPKVGISWYAANHYCKIQGKRLPTEAEWEKSARGPWGEKNPWGNETVDCSRAIIQSKKGRGCGRLGFRDDKGRTWDVGSRPAGRYGLYDLIGNTDEYVADWYSETYRECGKYCRGPNPKGPCNAAGKCSAHLEKVVRGGSWYWGTSHGYGSFRRAHFPSQRKIYHHFGFRCAKDSFTVFNFIFDYINKLIHF